MKDRSSRIGSRLVSLSAVVTPWLLAGSAGAAVSLRQGAAEPAGGAPTTTSTPVPVDARPNTATILIVQGNVQVRLTPEGEWTKAVAGTSISQGGAIRTALRSAAQVRVGSGQVMTIDRLTTVEFDQLVNESNTDRTRLGVDYGRVVFQVQSTEFANDLQIETADATLAVKGTEGGIDANPETGTSSFGTETNDGTFSVTYPDGTESDVSGDDETSTDNKDPAEGKSSNTEQDTGDGSAREGDEGNVVDRSTGGSDTTQKNSGTNNSEPAAPIVDADDNGNIIINTGGSGGSGASPPPPPPPPPPAPGDFTPLSPVSGMMNVMTSATFSWSGSSNATSYTLIISTNADLSNPMFTLTGLTSTSQLVNGLQPGETYFWQIIAFNAQGSNQFSPVTFGTESPLPTPGAFSILTPTIGMTNVMASTTFTWSASANATSYTLIISTNSNLSNPIVNRSGLTSTSEVVNGLQPGVMYFWRVIAMNAAGVSETMNGSFTTEPPPTMTQVQPNDFLISDIESGDLILHPLGEGASETHVTALPEAPYAGEFGAGSGGGYGGIYDQDDGMAARLNPDGSRTVYYVRGGSFHTDHTDARNDLYRLTISPTGVAGQWEHVTKYVPGVEGEFVVDAPVLSGLAFFGNSETTGLYGILRGNDQGLNQEPPIRGDGDEGDDFFTSRLVNIRRSPDSLDEIMNFTIPLDGALASSHSRGTMFLVGEIPETYLRPGRRAQARSERSGFYVAPSGATILEFDPRTRYLANSWRQFDGVESGGVFQPSEGTEIVTPEDPYVGSLFQAPVDVKGAAWVNGKLHLSLTHGFASESAREFPPPAYLVRVNPNPASGGAFIERIELNSGVHTSLAETIVGSPAASVSLKSHMGPIDDFTIDPAFARLAFSQQTIDSGFIVPLYQRHFLETAYYAYGCFMDYEEDGVFASIPMVLDAFVDTIDGIGHATETLRGPIRPVNFFDNIHPCAGEDEVIEFGPDVLNDFFFGADTDWQALALRPLSASPFDEFNVLDLPDPGVYAGGFNRDDGLASIFIQDDLRRVGDSGGVYYDTIAFYAYGGEEVIGEGYETYNELYYSYVPVEYYGGGYDIRGGGTGSEGDERGYFFQLMEKYVENDPGYPVSGEAAITGLAVFPGFGTHPNLVGITSFGWDRFNFSSTGEGGSQLVMVETDWNPATPNQLVPFASFEAPLEGGLATSVSRGSLFMVANLWNSDTLTQPRGIDAYDRSIIEFDPRANYIKNAWMGAPLGDSFGTDIDISLKGFTVYDLNDYFTPMRGAAFVNGRLILTSNPFVSVRGDVTTQNFYFNPDATGTDQDPYITKIEKSQGLKTALGETVEQFAEMPAAPVLTPDTLNKGEINLAGVNELFASIAYSQQALDSGVVRRVFEKHFLETSLDASSCKQSMLFTDQLPTTLAANKNRENGFGRTAFQLRQNLTQDHSCATEANPPGDSR